VEREGGAHASPMIRTLSRQRAIHDRDREMDKNEGKEQI
jgi:hypothetical protein